MGRFINADGLISTGQGLLGNNMFAYCGNNAVLNCDVSGMRHCAATTVEKEFWYDRYYSCFWQEQVLLEKYNPEPIGKTDNGNVYLVEDLSDVRTDFPGDIIIKDGRNKKKMFVQIQNSALIQEEAIQRQVLSLLDEWERKNPTKWERNTDIEDMLVEWDAHNDIYNFWHNSRCLHVDIDNADKGVSYGEYWWRAIYETLFN